MRTPLSPWLRRLFHTANQPIRARPRLGLGIESLEDRTVPAITLPTGFTQTTFATGFNTPTSMTFAPDGRLFVSEKAGDLRVVQANGTVLPTPFMHLNVLTFTDPQFGPDERGLLGMEEINNLQKGGNYGWPDAEGAGSNPGFINPIHAYQHPGNSNAAITGGVFQESTAFPAANRGYFFSDYLLNFIRILNPATNAVTTFATGASSPVDLDVAPDGSLMYLSIFTGNVFRIATPPPSSLTFTDQDNDQYTVKLSGPGQMAVTMDDPDANGKGPIARIDLQGTDATKTTLSITVKKALGMDGLVTLGAIEGTGLKSITAALVDLTGDGIDLTGALGGLTIHDIRNGADVFALGAPTSRTTITAHVIGDNTIFNLGTGITSFKAAAFGNGNITAPSLGTLTINGDAANKVNNVPAPIRGDFHAGLTLTGTGDAKKPGVLTTATISGNVVGSDWDLMGDATTITIKGMADAWNLDVSGKLGTATVSGAINGAVLNVNGNVSSFRAGAFTNSRLYLGFTPNDAGAPLMGGAFLPGLKLNSFTVSGIKNATTPAFVDSFVAANSLGTVSLNSIANDTAAPYGILANAAITGVTVTNPKFTFSAKLPTPQGVGDFQVRIAKLAILRSLDYFKAQFGIINAASGYPCEGFKQTGYTQPTAIGFYALLLGNIASGEVTVSHINALTSLEKIADSLLTDQADANIGFKGLLPWLEFRGSMRSRAAGEFGQQVALGDNLNLTTALAATVGALRQPALLGNAVAQRIVGKLEQFLDRQAEGYNYLFDATTGLFRKGRNFVNNTWIGGDNARQDYFGDEFRGGVLFAALRYGIPTTVYTKLAVEIQDYQLSNGNHTYTVSPYDGGAFQMLWPTLTMPETSQPTLRAMLDNFTALALDHATEHNLLGFLSASYTGADPNTSTYAGNIGIAEIAQVPGQIQNVASLYTLGAAHMIMPTEVNAFLDRILTTQPGLLSDHGFWEGISAAGTVIKDQVTANVVSLVLGMLGTGPAHMTRYLAFKNLTSQYDAVFADGQALNVLAGTVFNFESDDIHGRAYQFAAGQRVFGGQLHLQYSTNGQNIGPIKIEFKEPGSFTAFLTIDSLILANSGTGNLVLDLDLPLIALRDVGEITLLFGSAEDRTNVTLTEFSIT